MRSIRKSGITALTAAIALGIGAVPVVLVAGAMPDANPSNVVDTATLGDPAKLYLTTGVEDRVFLDQDANQTWAEGVEPTQDLAGQSRDCRLVTDDTLLSFDGAFTALRAGAPDPASFANDSLGVAEKKTGTSCSQVNASSGDVLTIRLGSELLGSYLIDSAELDVELKQSAVITAKAYLDSDADGLLEDAELVATHRLRSGASRTGQPGAFECTGAADSGPDSGVGDNCAWPIDSEDDVVFDSLVLKADVGSFSVEGGGDGTSLAPTSFTLVEGEFDCWTSRTIDASADGSHPAVTATRLGNADGSQCAGVRFRFTNGESFAELLKPIDEEETAQFIYDLVWTQDADTTWGDNAAAGLVTRTVVDFDSEGDLDDETSIAACPDLVPALDENGDPTEYLVVSDPANNPSVTDQAKGFPADDEATPTDEDTVQFACLISQSIEPKLDTDKVIVAERIYAYGDIRLLK